MEYTDNQTNLLKWRTHMNALGSCQVDARGFTPTVQIRELTTSEVDEVSGGILPLIVVAAVAIAVVMEECGEESPSESDDSESADGDD